MKAYTATCTRRILVAMVMGLSLVLAGSELVLRIEPQSGDALADSVALRAQVAER